MLQQMQQAAAQTKYEPASAFYGGTPSPTTSGVPCTLPGLSSTNYQQIGSENKNTASFRHPSQQNQEVPAGVTVNYEFH